MPGRPFEAANEAALVHGARSERQIRPIAAAHRRSVLRRFGLRVADLTAVQRGYLDLYVRAMSKIDLYDRWIEENGLLSKTGKQPGFMATYVSTMNAARLNLGRLEESLRDHPKRDPTAALADYIEATYSEDNGDGD